jgi:hypothetical protein
VHKNQENSARKPLKAASFVRIVIKSPTLSVEGSFGGERQGR